MFDFNGSVLQGFDPRTVDPSQFSSIPLGDYKCVIVDTEPKQNTKGTGGYLQVDVKITEGQFAGMLVMDNLSLFHTDSSVVNMAKRRLSAYAHVLGLGATPLQNSAQLHNIPFIATIGPQELNSKYNEVKIVKDLQGNIPGKANANPVAQGQPAQPTTQWPAANAAPVQTQPAQTWAAPQPTYAPPVVQAQPPATPAKLPWETGNAAPANPASAPWSK